MRGRQPPLAADADTRERLIQSATRLFGERGFDKVTVREIVMAARANVAAVNYHFEGKLGLYTEVIERAITLMRRVNDETRNAPPGSSPEERLRHFVRTFLAIGSHPGDMEWIDKLVRHEMENPTPAVRSIVRQVMAPRVRYLSEVIGELVGAAESAESRASGGASGGATIDDDFVRRCTLSVQAQCFFVQHMIRVKGRLRAAGLSEFSAVGTVDVEAFAEHIVRFSLAGIRGGAEAVAHQP